MKSDNFFAELKRRIVGWLVVQVATQVFPFFEIPNWAVRLVVLLIIVGFPIALVIAWPHDKKFRSNSTTITRSTERARGC